MRKETPNLLRRPRPVGDPSGKRGNIAPTLNRRYHGEDHLSPMRGMTDDEGSMWKGTSRIVDRARKRRLNKASWRKITADARRAVLAGENIYTVPVHKPSTDGQGGD